MLKIGEFVFVWDDTKNNANIKKHGLSFEDAAELWKHPESVLDIADTRFEYNEERWIALGSLPTNRRKIVVVAYCEKSDVVRIISARFAEKSEEIAYRNRLKGEKCEDEK